MQDCTDTVGSLLQQSADVMLQKRVKMIQFVVGSITRHPLPAVVCLSFSLLQNSTPLMKFALPQPDDHALCSPLIYWPPPVSHPPCAVLPSQQQYIFARLICTCRHGGSLGCK